MTQGVLIGAGGRADGHREILAVTVADTESEATCHQLFGDLKVRGLSGEYGWWQAIATMG